MNDEAIRIENLGIRFAFSMALLKLWAGDGMWRLEYLRRALDISLYEELATYAEEGLIVFPNGTYWDARLTDLGRKVMEWGMGPGLEKLTHAQSA